MKTDQLIPRNNELFAFNGWKISPKKFVIAGVDCIAFKQTDCAVLSFPCETSTFHVNQSHTVHQSDQLNAESTSVDPRIWLHCTTTGNNFTSHP